MARVRHVLVDVAGTLLIKPDLIATIGSVLARHGFDVDRRDLIARHKLVSELVEVPDHTTPEFYRRFNAGVLRAIGIVPEASLLDELYERCRRLPWQPAPGATGLSALGVPLGVVSNWGVGLIGTLSHLGLGHLHPVVASSEVGLRKPDPAIFTEALDRIGLPSEEVLYVGDSLRLDIEPAAEAGMLTALYDPHALFPAHRGARIEHLESLHKLVPGGPDRSLPE